MGIKEQCCICDKSYRDIKQHMYEKHNNNPSKRQHNCIDCGKKFTKGHDLKMHIDRIHLHKKFICPQCDKRTTKIREHLREVHSVSSINMADIKVEFGLKSNEAASVPKPHMCDECEKSFGSKSDLKALVDRVHLLILKKSMRTFGDLKSFKILGLIQFGLVSLFLVWLVGLVGLLSDT